MSVHIIVVSLFITHIANSNTCTYNELLSLQLSADVIAVYFVMTLYCLH